jgi:hypothetical protein
MPSDSAEIAVPSERVMASFNDALVSGNDVLTSGSDVLLMSTKVVSKTRLLLVHEYKAKIKGYWCLAPEKGTNVS